MPETNYFTDLLSVQCETEKKGKLTYISWIEAWSKLKAAHPGATYEVHRTEAGGFLHGEGFVMVSVTVPGAFFVEGPEIVEPVTHTMWLPVMDHQNRAITDPDPTQINKAVMRCLAKACAMHGLGAYVYMGEDLPTVDPPVDYAAKLAELEGWAVGDRSADDVAAARAKVAMWPQPFRAKAEDALGSLAKALA